ncbi:14648_t:CDS:1 [Cetraspora pellucida]|uniref:14648_t:CDS:1 n=1 Tax=Cetraspora pellucida TaxID=1433469 RepID=A0ACA9LQL4_9GLOM|nr:14648_t:CDS:1 [Cetraspora pellucida]
MNTLKDEWPLKTKDGVVITIEQMPIELRNKISKLNRQDLFPPKFGIDEIEKPEYNVDGSFKEKRWMNCFLCFRRVLGLCYKDSNTVFNGTELSQLAQLIWRGASFEEKKVYSDISSELKKKTYIQNPNFVFRKTPRPTEEYINYGPETFEKKGKRKHEDDEYGQRNKKRINKKDTGSTDVVVLGASGNEESIFISNTDFDHSNTDFDPSNTKFDPSNTDPITSNMAINSNTNSLPNLDSVISNLDSVIMDSSTDWFPYNGQDFTDSFTSGGSYIQNNVLDTDSTADQVLWIQSYAPTVDPGINMPLGFSENIYSNEIMWDETNTNFEPTYDISEQYNSEPLLFFPN